jgi:hypothetical protein
MRGLAGVPGSWGVGVARTDSIFSFLLLLAILKGVRKRRRRVSDEILGARVGERDWDRERKLLPRSKRRL